MTDITSFDGRAFEQLQRWLVARRNEYAASGVAGPERAGAWYVVDGLLDELREAAAEGRLPGPRPPEPPLPRGEYGVRVAAAEERVSPTSGPYVQLRLEVTSPEEYRGRVVWRSIRRLWHDDAVALGVNGEPSLDGRQLCELVVGRECRASIRVVDHRGESRNDVRRLLP